MRALQPARAVAAVRDADARHRRRRDPRVRRRPRGRGPGGRSPGRARSRAASSASPPTTGGLAVTIDVAERGHEGRPRRRARVSESPADVGGPQQQVVQAPLVQPGATVRVHRRRDAVRRRRRSAWPSSARRRDATAAGQDASIGRPTSPSRPQLAARAGELLVERFEKVERIDFKSAKDVVTEVDHLSEDADPRRDPGGVSRATGSSPRRAASTSAAGARRRPGVGRAWIIDPLDGTINYANGIPFFCVSIALVEAGRPVVGVIHDPIRRRDVRRDRRRAGDARRRADRRPRPRTSCPTSSSRWRSPGRR